MIMTTKIPQSSGPGNLRKGDLRSQHCCGHRRTCSFHVGVFQRIQDAAAINWLGSICVADGMAMAGTICLWKFTIPVGLRS